MTEQRRYTDHIERTSDHDLLIKLHTKIDSICSNLTANTKAIKDLSDKIDIRCDRRNEVCAKAAERKLDSPTFWKLVVSLTIIIGSLSSAVGINLVTSTENKTLITQHVKNVEGR